MAIWRWRAPGGNAAAPGSRRENGMPVAMSVCSRRLLLAISLLAIAGIAVSSVSLYHHYGSSRTSYCDIGENFNCDRSEEHTSELQSRYVISYAVFCLK